MPMYIPCTTPQGYCLAFAILLPIFTSSVLPTTAKGRWTCQQQRTERYPPQAAKMGPRCLHTPAPPAGVSLGREKRRNEGRGGRGLTAQWGRCHGSDAPATSYRGSDVGETPGETGVFTIIYMVSQRPPVPDSSR